MTPDYAWENIKHIIPKDKQIWEAFYGDGKSGECLKRLGFDVIHKDIDFFENDLGETVYKNYLNVSVAPAAAIEFQHFKDTIIEKINTYFGYKAIMDLRIHQNYIPKHTHMKQSKKKQINKDDIRFVEENVKEFQNLDLKKSLLNLGNKITTEDK